MDSQAEVLYLQMDGASGENKNRWVAMFCACLVQLSAFKKVKISFLPVGHTHEDIDQMLSRFSIALRASGAKTVAALAELLTRAFAPTPIVFTSLPLVVDFKQWIQPYAFKQWSQITFFRAYKITMHPNGYPVVFNRAGMAGTRQLLFRNKVGMLTADQNEQLRWVPEFGQRILDGLPDFDKCTHSVSTRPLEYAETMSTVNTLVGQAFSVKRIWTCGPSTSAPSRRWTRPSAPCVATTERHWPT